MEPTILVINAALIFLVTLTLIIIFRGKINSLATQLDSAILKYRDLEKSIHTNETRFLEDKNHLQINYHTEQRAAREKSFQEGVEHGRAEREKDHIIEITNLRAEHREKIAFEREEASKSAREILRSEFETQTKMFSVVIRPYVKIEKDTGIIFDSHKSFTGYQYQLLVNGIPAFQPHIVIENSEDLKVVDKDVVKSLLKIAESAANVAANTYLGGAPASVIKIASEVIENTKI
jgi:hypothetical protein